MRPIFLWSTVVNQLQKPVSRRRPSDDPGRPSRERSGSPCRSRSPPSRQAVQVGDEGVDLLVGQLVVGHLRAELHGVRDRAATPSSASVGRVGRPSCSRRSTRGCRSAKCVRFGAGGRRRRRCRRSRGTRCTAPRPSDSGFRNSSSPCRRADRSDSTARLLLVRDPRLPVRGRERDDRGTSSGRAAARRTPRTARCTCPARRRRTGCGSCGPARRPACRTAGAPRTSGSPGSRGRRVVVRRSARRPTRGTGRPSRPVGTTSTSAIVIGVVAVGRRMSWSVYSKPHHHW